MARTTYGWDEAARLRRRARAGSCCVPPADAVERRRGARTRRVVRRVAPHGESERDRADDRLASRRGRLPAATEPGIGERSARVAVERTLCREGESSSRTRLDARARAGGARVALRTATTAPAVELLDDRRRTGRGRARTSSSACGSGRAHRGSGASWTNACCRPRRASRSGRSASQRAATRGRSRSPDSTTGAREPGPARARAGRRRELPARRRAALEGKAVGRVTSAARDPEAGVVALAYVRRRWPPMPCSGGRARRTPTDGRAPRLTLGRLPLPGARSSGDRALPCGGRGRKFESCRAH